GLAVRGRGARHARTGRRRAATRRLGADPAAQLHAGHPCPRLGVRLAGRAGRGPARPRPQLLLPRPAPGEEAMTVYALRDRPPPALALALTAFEHQFTYPLGPGRTFRLSHGDDYPR